MMRISDHTACLTAALLSLVAAGTPVGAQVRVSPDGGVAQAPPNSTGQQVWFSLTGLVQGQNYTLEWYCSGNVTFCTSPNGSSVPGSQFGASVPIKFNTTSIGSGQVKLKAFGAGSSDSGWFNVSVVTFGVTVTPHDAQITRLQNSSGSELFTVTNTGSGSNTYTFSCTPGTGVTCGTVPPPVTLGPGLNAQVSMPYSVATPTFTSLRLYATGTSASDNGNYFITVISSNGSFVPAAVSMGMLTKDPRYLLQETANTYDLPVDGGRIKEVADARGARTQYTYGGNTTNAFLTQVKRLHDGTGPIDLVTNIAYAEGSVFSIQDEGGSFRYFTYDLFGRLRQIKNHAQLPVRAYGYTYSRTGPNWTFDPANPNAVVDTTFLKQTPMVPVVRTSYVDGRGREIQSVLQDGTNYHVTATQYDFMGRTWRVWKPYTRQTAGFDPNATSPTAGATAWYNTYHSPSGTLPYAETAYAPDPLGRVTQVTPERLVGAPNAVVTRSYNTSPSEGLQLSLLTDEAAKSTRTVTDVFGNVVRSILGAGAPESTVTQFTYSVLGQRLQTTDPRGLVTTYAVNTRGLQTSRTSPDAGTMQVSYDKAGNVRFTQDANQAIPGQVYFTNYDFAARPLKSGLATATFASLNPDVSQAFEADSLNCRVARAYDAKPGTAATNFPWNHFAAQVAALTLSNVAGRLAGVANKSNGAWQATLFSYDADGRISKRYTYTEANGGGSVLTVVNTTVEDSVDLRGVITKRAQTVGIRFFYQWFEYDARGLLSKTYSDTLNSKPGVADATDTYRPGGLPTDHLYQGGVLVPIRYTIREQIERIGDPAAMTYPFSARYAYQANGVVETAEFYNGGLPAPQRRYRYAFGLGAYDALNRMKSADFSIWSAGAWTATSNYDLTAITYDSSGNLKTLQRRNDVGTLIDNLTYSYAPGTNRLASLSEAAGVTPEAWDAEGAAFGYDANGNVTLAPAPYSINSATYDPANLPLSITTASGTSTYRYDAAGARITKQANGGNTEVYVRVGSIVVGVFTLNGNTLVSWSFNILWNDRVIGRQTSVVRTYYHFDHLGSVRAVVTNAGSITESSDFDPWGLSMPGRALVSASPSKEKFSGKEHDGETGLDYFGGRYYMAAVARWAAVDISAGAMPSYSPYVYSFNSPLSAMDPDGEFPILITVRAFAPYNVFGLIFRGDGRDRQFSTYQAASSRISQRTSIETAYWGLDTRERGDISRDIIGSRRDSWASGEASLVSAGNRADLQTHVWGRNSLFEIGSPDIDVHTSLSLSVSTADPKTGNQILSITGTVSGDNFPATEAFVTDAKGRSVFLGVAGAQMGPVLGPFNLIGDKRATTMNVNVQILVDKNGNFTAVRFAGATIPIQTWNAIFQHAKTRTEDVEP